VPSDNHRANIAERCIETGKYHIISNLAGTDDAFPINQCDRIILQASAQPKSLCISYMEGHHDYNHVPFVPLGLHTLVFEDLERQALWAYHGIEESAVGPAQEHNRCTTCWIPTTGAECISDTIMMFPPTHMTLPSLPIPEETVNEAACELGGALQQMVTNNPAYVHLGSYAGLSKLTDIVHSTTTKTRAQRVVMQEEKLWRMSTAPGTPRQSHNNVHVIPFNDDKVAQPQRVPQEDEPRPAPRPTCQLCNPL
ncbi:hypothetical protein ACHAWF_013188, partial [Thalassiosira exigua]